MYRLSWTMCFLFLLPAVTHSHSEYKSRYVAETGKDHAGCDSPLRPCKTIAYAASRAVKGEKIFVASGNYYFDDVQNLFYITSGTIQAFGGYNRYEHFQKQAPAKNPTRLLGVPIEYREQMESRGFLVIADGRSSSRKRGKALQEFVAEQKQLRASKKSAPCVNGQSDMFACDNLDLLSQISIDDLGAAGANRAANDVWGFVDLNTDREYAFIGVNVATAVVDVTQADNPVIVGRIPGQDTVWRDIKVYQFYDRTARRWNAYAYVTADSANEGVVIIDLNELPNRISVADRITLESSAHNVYISNVDYATGLTLGNAEPVLYTAGANLSNGAFRGYGLSNPTSPSFLGTANTGYMHDASSLVISDSRKDTQCANGGAVCNVLVDFNELSFELWDVTDTGNPVQLSSRNYNNVNYVHSGWWSEDKQFIFVQDELDELNANLSTTLRVFDVSDLLNPVLARTWTGSTSAIDHNGFVKGNRYYMSNYERGITVLDITDPTDPSRVGFFDTFPSSNRAAFNGAWGAYPYLPSGNILVSDDIGGLFVLADNARASTQGQLGFTQSAIAVTEGNSASISVQRANGSSGAVSVDYSILNASTDDTDYQASQGTLSWAVSDTTDKVISLAINADGVSEGLERLLVRLSNPQGGATLSNVATSVFVSDISSSPMIDMLMTSIPVAENQGTATVTVRRTGSALGPVSVDYQTLSGTATAGEDFVASSGSLSWSDGDGTGKIIQIALLDDSLSDPDEIFSVEISSPIGATLANSSTEIAFGNRPPVANAGPDLAGNEGTQVTLSANDSSDPDGDVLSYSWEQTAGVQITLTDTNTADLTFTLPEVAQNELTTFTVTVTDENGFVATDTANLTVGDTSNSNPGGVTGGGGGGPVGIVFLLLALIRLTEFLLPRERESRII